MDKIDYLIVTGHATKGQEIVTNQRKKMLEELGYASTVFCLSNGVADPFSRKLTRKLGLPDYFLRHTKIVHFVKSAYIYRKNLEKYLKHTQPDVIEFYCPDTIILQNKQILKNYKIVASFDLPFGVKNFFGSNVLSYLEKKKFYQANLILSLTNFGKQFLIERYGIDGSKIAHIPYAYDGIEVKKYKVSDEGFAISYCSDIMMWRKGLDILIEAWKIVHKNKKLIVTGLNRTNAEYFLNKKNIEIPNNIEFIGMLPREEYLNMLSKSSFFISPTRWEDFGQAVIEALSFGKVVVSTPTIGPSELLQQIDPNLISQSFSPIDLSQTIRYAEALLNNPAVQKNIGKVIHEYEYANIKSRVKEKIANLSE